MNKTWWWVLIAVLAVSLFFNLFQYIGGRVEAAKADASFRGLLQRLSSVSRPQYSQPAYLRNFRDAVENFSSTTLTPTPTPTGGSLGGGGGLARFGNRSDPGFEDEGLDPNVDTNNVITGSGYDCGAAGVHCANDQRCILGVCEDQPETCGYGSYEVDWCPLDEYCNSAGECVDPNASDTSSSDPCDGVTCDTLHGYYCNGGVCENVTCNFFMVLGGSVCESDPDGTACQALIDRGDGCTGP